MNHSVIHVLHIVILSTALSLTASQQPHQKSTYGATTNTTYTPASNTQPNTSLQISSHATPNTALLTPSNNSTTQKCPFQHNFKANRQRPSRGRPQQ